MTPRPSASDSPTMSAIQGEAAAEPGRAEWPYRDVDPRTGRLRPIPDEEWRARMADLTRELAEIDAQDDTPHVVYDEVLRGIDEERRLQGRPPAFEGHY